MPGKANEEADLPDLKDCHSARAPTVKSNDRLTVVWNVMHRYTCS